MYNSTPAGMILKDRKKEAPKTRTRKRSGKAVSGPPLVTSLKANIRNGATIRMQKSRMTGIR